MQLNYFVVNKVVQGYICGNTVPIFHKQAQKRSTADNCCKILHPSTAKNQKLLFTVRQRSGKNVMIVIQQKL